MQLQNLDVSQQFFQLFWSVIFRFIQGGPSLLTPAFSASLQLKRSIDEDEREETGQSDSLMQHNCEADKSSAFFKKSSSNSIEAKMTMSVLGKNVPSLSFSDAPISGRWYLGCLAEHHSLLGVGGCVQESGWLLVKFHHYEFVESLQHQDCNEDGWSAIAAIVPVVVFEGGWRSDYIVNLVLRSVSGVTTA